MINSNLQNRIDIIGPPGAGKSTIYNEVCIHWRKTSPWIYLDKLQKNDNIFHPVKWDSETGLLQQIKLLLRGDGNRYRGLGTKFIAENQKLVSLIWKLLEKNNESNPYRFDYRIKNAHHAYKDFERIQFIKEMNDSRPCLMAEGLLHKSYLKNGVNGSLDETLRQYITICPLPVMVFILRTDTIDETVDRRMNRPKRNAGELNYDSADFCENVRSWIRLFTIMENYLIRAGVNVFHINTSQPVKRSAQDIIKIMELKKMSLSPNSIPGPS